MKIPSFLLRGLILPAFFALPLAAQTLSIDHDSYSVGAPVTATWTGGPANPKDWVGIYRVGDTPGPVASRCWAYVSGTTTATTGIADGSITFTFADPLTGGPNSTTNLPAGNYFMGFFRNDGYVELAERRPFTVADISIASFKASSSFIKPGEPLTLQWTITDFGLPVDHVEIDDGADYHDATGTTSLQLPMPADTNAYILTVTGGNGTVVQSKLTVWKDQGNSANFSLDHHFYSPGEPITVTWANAIGGATDWIGLYRASDTPGPTPSRLWTYAAATEGTTTFTNSLPPGEYFAIRLLNDLYDIEYGPVRFVVVDPATFRITAQSGAGADLSLTWLSDPVHPAYRIESSDDLELWTPVEGQSGIAPATGATTTSRTFPRPAAQGDRQFYRIAIDGD